MDLANTGSGGAQLRSDANTLVCQATQVAMLAQRAGFASGHPVVAGVKRLVFSRVELSRSCESQDHAPDIEWSWFDGLMVRSSLCCDPLCPSDDRPPDRLAGVDTSRDCGAVLLSLGSANFVF